MSDLTYRWTRHLCNPIVWISSMPVVIHADRAAISGGYILAASHLSPFDAPLLVRHAPRLIDFLATDDLRRKSVVRCLISLFNVFYVDRRRRDTGAVLAAVRRLRRGRVVGMFPEGGIRAPADSVLSGGSIHPGIARMAEIADVPVIPCVVLGANQYHRVLNWLPRRATRYGIIFGLPLRVPPAAAGSNPHESFVQELRQSYVNLSEELSQAMQSDT